MRSRRWLTLGIGVKRYILLIFAGTVILALALAMFLAFVYRTIDVPGPAGSVVYYMTLQFIEHPFRSLVVGGLGLAGVVAGGFLLGRTVLSVVVSPDDNIAETLYQSRRLQRGPRIVAIGGGTGLGILLRGLKEHTNNITAVVTVADDGGSSGRLREEFGLAPPGDVRQCLAALADSESLMNEVMNYRFSRGGGLQGTQPGQSVNCRDHRAQGRDTSRTACARSATCCGCAGASCPPPTPTSGWWASWRTGASCAASPSCGRLASPSRACSSSRGTWRPTRRPFKKSWRRTWWCWVRAASSPA